MEERTLGRPKIMGDLEDLQVKSDNILEGANTSLDTFKEVGDALGNDANFANTITNELGTKSDKVHNHQASQVTFTDGKTFQQKLEDGSLVGPKGDQGIAGPVNISDAINGTSSSIAASQKAVKTAYDKAEQAFQSANNGKIAIASAITGKGVSASGSDTHQVLATKIGQIPSAMGMSTQCGFANLSNPDHNNTVTFNIPVSAVDTTKHFVTVLGESLYSYSMTSATNLRIVVESSASPIRIAWTLVNTPFASKVHRGTSKVSVERDNNITHELGLTTGVTIDLSKVAMVHLDVGDRVGTSISRITSTQIFFRLGYHSSVIDSVNVHWAMVLK